MPPSTLAYKYNTRQPLAAANRCILTFEGMLRSVNVIWILQENGVSLYSEEENARKCRAFSSFWLKNQAQKGCFTLRVGDSYITEKNFSWSLRKISP